MFPWRKPWMNEWMNEKNGCNPGWKNDFFFKELIIRLHVWELQWQMPTNTNTGTNGARDPTHLEPQVFFFCFISFFLTNNYYLQVLHATTTTMTMNAHQWHQHQDTSCHVTTTVVPPPPLWPPLTINTHEKQWKDRGPSGEGLGSLVCFSFLLSFFHFTNVYIIIIDYTNSYDDPPQ